MKKEYKYLNKTPREILSMLTLRQKVAQTIVPAYYSFTQGREAVRNGVGGLWPVLYAGQNYSGSDVAADTVELAELAEIPLFITMDMETGTGQVIHDGLCTEFSEPMAYSAIADIADAERLAYLQGKAMAAEAMSIGWNMTPTPVVDVNINPSNPITNIRSCGDDPKRVSRIMCAMIQGMQEIGIIPMAKHFPGAGMQKNDSHFDCERITLTQPEMNEVHLKPFRDAIQCGLRCIMTNHAIYEAYDKDNVSTLSPAVMTDLLRNKLGYTNLVMTDAMGMQGVTEQGKGSEAAIKALAAGNDLILAPSGNDSVIDDIVAAVENGRLSADIIDAACLRILEGKAWQENFKTKLSFPDGSNKKLAEEIASKAATVIRDVNQLLPLKKIDGSILVIEPAHPNKLLDYGLYTNTTMIYNILKIEHPNVKFMLFKGDIDESEKQELAKQAEEAEYIVISTSFRSYAGQVGLLTEPQTDTLREIAAVNPNIIAVTANPYASAQIPFIGTVMCGYSTSKVMVEVLVDILVGRRSAQGKLGIRLPEKFDSSSVSVSAHD
ncbi:MAG: hypothetical protein FWF15_00620 [Oscillospiraceae bacterium]|nr:hypothetical protein [Oscillospiraceae bacterium]